MSWMTSLPDYYVPQSPEKVPLTIHTFTTLLLPFLGTYLSMACLVMLPETVFFRRLILSSVLALGFRAVLALDLSNGDIAMAHVNQTFGLGVFMMFLRSIDWATRTKPITRRIIAVNLRRDSTEQPKSPTSPVPRTLGHMLQDACDLTVNFRGLGWDGYLIPHIPQESRSMRSTTVFLGQTFLSLCLHACMCDTLQYCIRSFSPDTFGSPVGGTIFDASLPPIHRFVRSTMITTFFGWSVYAIAQATYDLATILAVLIFRQHPSQWPPMFDAPYRSASLADLWGKRWHQHNRNILISCGAKPMAYLLGRYSGTLGAFALSGIMHDFGLRAANRGSDFCSVGGFFLMMGVGVILERLWVGMTGRKVCGIFGWLWTVSWVTGWGNMLVDAWLVRGAAGTPVIPAPYSPIKHITFLSNLQS
ncbi:membrane bound O-acyl transferase family-domain-containing protein [Hygrophoropsis aurantiaca]|uniref:Membrane bound O-acyl transferase family-domain-containing protein n=1 Tax=Hygrophoropsis aurantiaca TaxID=72124 RepID=A0ACB8AH47_9AGAM|nr:membrane bound O-acyl transferase family-domain-containing protein [Hygrophoropsis aurantiaca]